MSYKSKDWKEPEVLVQSFSNSAVQQGEIHIWLVDDNLSYLSSLTTFLNNCIGMKVTKSTTIYNDIYRVTQQANPALQPPSIIIADLFLNDLREGEASIEKGLAFIKRMKHAFPQTPLIAITASAVSRDKNQALEAGADLCLLKKELASNPHRIAYEVMELVQPVRNILQKIPVPEIVLTPQQKHVLDVMKTRNSHSWHDIKDFLKSMDGKTPMTASAFAYHTKSIRSKFGVTQIGLALEQYKNNFLS